MQENMQEIEIRHCASCRPIERDEAKYQTDIIATGCTWRANLTVDYALQNAPNVGQTYFVTLHQPVKFSLNMALWLFYDCPLAHYNGYETEAEIEAAKFCFGEITNIIARDELGATVEFIVTKTLAFQDILETKKATELPQFWTDFFVNFIERQAHSLEQFGKYYQLNASAEGDLGQHCIFTKQDNEFFICMLNEWSFSENGTFGGKYKLPESIKDKIIRRAG